MDYSDELLGLDCSWSGDSSKEERIQCFHDVKEELKEDISYLSDEKIFRFLKARQFQFEDCIEMIQNHLEFRQFHNQDDPTFDHFSAGKEALDANYFRVAGLDKEFRPILVYEGQRLPIDTPWSNLVDDHMIIHLSKQFVEPLHALFGQSKCTCIANAECFNPFTQFHVDLITNFMTRGETQNPEGSHKVFIVNFPWVAQMAWTFCQGFIHEKTLSNIKMCEDEDELLDLMDQEMLEEKFGGKHCEYPPMSDREFDFRALVLEAKKAYPENEKVLMAMKVIECLDKEAGHIYFDVKEIRKKVDACKRKGSVKKNSSLYNLLF